MRKRILQLFLFAGLMFSLSGCTAALYEVKGRVVRAPAAQPANGFFQETTEQTLAQSGAPVAGAKVRMITRLNEQGKPLNMSDEPLGELTDENGYFYLKMYHRPSKNLTIGIEVSKDGYQTLYATQILAGDSAPKIILANIVPNSTK